MWEQIAKRSKQLKLKLNITVKRHDEDVRPAKQRKRPEIIPPPGVDAGL